MRIEPEPTRDPSLHYIERVNLAIDHIVQNLDQPLNLESIAAVTYFSPHHFHRIFRAIVGETLTQFIKRLRLERALRLLAHGRPDSLADVAAQCGFSSLSDFSRSFKQRYGVPPSAFDLDTFRKSRREDLDALVAPSAEANQRIYRLPPGENPDGFKVALRNLPARSVAYIRVLDPYRPDVVLDASRRLEAWADERGFGDGRWLGYMWEDPEIVALKDCRYDVAVELPDPDAVEFDGEVGRFDFPPMLVAQIEMRGPIEMEMRALDWIYRTWLPTSPYVPADLPGFEVWMGRPFAHGVEHFELYLQIPVVRR